MVSKEPSLLDQKGGKWSQKNRPFWTTFGARVFWGCVFRWTQCSFFLFILFD